MGLAKSNDNKEWALILGGSDGLGLATARKLSAHGYHLLIVHRDRRADLEIIDERFKAIGSNGIQIKSFNADATNSEKRTEIIDGIKEQLTEEGKIRVLVHSIAKGSMKPMYPQEDRNLDHQDLLITLNAMALSLYDWTAALVKAKLFTNDARIVSFTSEGNQRAWPGYAAVSAAKVALEALTRNIALEFAPVGIKANCVQAGLTDTKALAMIPGHKALKKSALERNPHGRLTLPEDVANAVYLLTTDEAKWITGTIIKVDGGESLR